MISCGFIIEDKSNKILVGTSTRYSVVWCVPKGKMEDGESYLDTAIRELKEETNIDYYSLDVKYFLELPFTKYKYKNKKLKLFYIKVTNDLSLYELKSSTYFEDKYGNKFHEMDKFTFLELHKLIEKSFYAQRKALEYLSNQLQTRK